MRKRIREKNEQEILADKMINEAALNALNKYRLKNLYNQYFCSRPIEYFEKDIINLIYGIKKAYGE
jgi:hypothetical protein